MTATIHLSLQHAMRFEATGSDGTTVLLDADPTHGGTSGGFRPMELLLVGLGGCAGMDVLSILRKKRQMVTAYHVRVSARSAPDVPHVFTDIEMCHIVHGDNLAEAAIQRAIELSETKYCPAYAMLAQAAQITSSYEIHPTAPAD